ncbi:MAG: zinc-binding dehydrogenase [Clostridia bacterium]|nr:zinc-binding dehydrogenase [Clostridia bacterium]
MINHIYQLEAPRVLSVKYDDVTFGDKVVVRPEYMAVCHADQRYFLGQRDPKVLRQKLPMALIHECCGTVVYDPEGEWQPGQRVVLIPNVPGNDDAFIYENYQRGGGFLSSGHDGFMRELVELDRDRVVPYNDVDPSVAAVCEFISVAVHATTRFDRVAHARRRRIGLWGDGSLSYTVACVLKQRFPDSELVVVGREPSKLAQFSFADETYFSDDLPDDLAVDHAFECCGGEGSYYAIEDVIRCINPQGTLVLMGVSENRVAIQTRMVLEKGMTLVGCSRSGREDFEMAVQLLQQPRFGQRMKVIVYPYGPVRKIGDIYKVFAEDQNTPFKTVFKWEL